MIKFRFVFILLSIFLVSMTVDKPAYRIFDVRGKKTTYSKMLKDISECEVILFGEQHDNPICHWLELQVTKDLFALKKHDLVLGGEMFEAPDQDIINQYLKGEIVEDTFRKQSHLWKNYRTDYKPLVEFAKNETISLVATNIARKYASMVYKDGFKALDTLDAAVKKFMAPLPIAYDADLEQYKKMLEDVDTTHSSPNLPKAQAIKDATMAYFINAHLAPGKLFLHFNGSYHSDYFEGIMWYLKQKNPDMRILTIATVEQKDISKLSAEYIMAADYIICVPDDMTKTY